MPSPSYDDLITWLRDQLDEEERDAREWLAGNAESRESGLNSTTWDEEDYGSQRRLREIAAYRAILGQYEQAAEWYNAPANSATPAGEVTGLWFAVKQVASIYADRPGFREEWASG